MSAFMSVASMMPDCLMAERMMAWSEAMLAVWLMAALAPPGLRPPLSSTMGLSVSDARRRNLLGSTMDSA